MTSLVQKKLKQPLMISGPVLGWKTTETKSQVPKIQNIGDHITLAPSQSQARLTNPLQSNTIPKGAYRMAQSRALNKQKTPHLIETSKYKLLTTVEESHQPAKDTDAQIDDFI
jgi:hypothetical protein